MSTFAPTSRRLPSQAHPLLVVRLTKDLLDNAIRYNLPENGEVTATTGIVGGTAYLGVESTGQPVPAYEIPSLFEPFRRLPRTERLVDATATSNSRELDSGCRSSAPWPRPTAARSRPRLGKTEASPWRSDFPPHGRDPHRVRMSEWGGPIRLRTRRSEGGLRGWRAPLA